MCELQLEYIALSQNACILDHMLPVMHTDVLQNASHVVSCRVHDVVTLLKTVVFLVSG